MSIYLDILANNINTFLQKNFKRPAWLAEKSGVNAPNISKILNRTGNPTLETIASLAKAMEIQPGDLIRFYEDPREFELVIIGRKLNDKYFDLENLKKKYEHRLNPNARTREHPSVVQKEIESVEHNISVLEEKANSIREKLGRPKKIALESREVKQEITTTPFAHDASRAQRILDLQTKLLSLSDDDLGVIEMTVNGLIDMSDIAKDDSSPKAK